MFYKFDKNALKYVKVPLVPIFLKIFGVLLALILILGLNYGITFQNNNSEKEILLIMGKYNEFSEDKLVAEIDKRNFKFPHIILAQAMLETGNFTSSIFKQNHNLFGMKEATKRPTLAIETQNNHAFYDNWRESLEDYGYYYCTYLGRMDTEDEYYEYISQYYSESPQYVQKLKDIIKIGNLKELFSQK